MGGTLGHWPVVLCSNLASMAFGATPDSCPRQWSDDDDDVLLVKGEE